jgi:Protein of unknown function (DUF1091)
MLSTSNNQYANFSSKIGVNANDQTSINISLNFGHNITKMTIFFKFSIAKDKNDKNYEKVLLETNVNACKMVGGVVGDIVTRMIMENLKQHSTIPLKCPYMKVIY